MKNPIISGIQQMGVGIPDVYGAWEWYRKYFGIDIPLLDEVGEASLMLPYTGGKARKRHAVLAFNIQGGGGLEIWQYKERTPQSPDFEVQLGDFGIFAAKIKSRDVKATYELFKKNQLNIRGELSKTPEGKEHFFVNDPFGNLFEIVSGNSWFHLNGHLTGGIYGAVLGVSDIEVACHFYKTILGYDEIVYHEMGQFEDFHPLNGGKHEFRRLVLKHSEDRKGCFSRLLGPSELELIEVQDRKPEKIFKNRLWGDLGFIHLSFDIRGMESMRHLCESHGHPFTVDSRDTFDMGQAAGHFSYIEDPDGTLIEFVETHKVPIVKKLNLYLNLRKRPPEKPLPNWMVRSLAFNRVKD